MGVVETEQPHTIRCMQRERVRQPMWPLLGRLNAFNLELDPVAFFEVVDTSIEGQ
jgi:hypothetical protein